MNKPGQHCPFLNRAERRCAEHLALHSLDYAFEHCFGRYAGCSVYVQLLVERRIRESDRRVVRPGAQTDIPAVAT